MRWPNAPAECEASKSAASKALAAKRLEGFNSTDASPGLSSHLQSSHTWSVQNRLLTVDEDVIVLQCHGA